MKKLTLILALVLALPMAAFAEKPEKLEKTKYLSDQEHKMAFSVELLGRAIGYSLNFDYMVTDNIALGAGFSMLSVSTASSGVTSSASIFLLPLYGNFYFATENHRPFVTAGLDVASGAFSSSTFGNGTSTSSIIVLGAGYEFRADGGFLFRVAPYYLSGGGSSMVWFGLGFGYAF